MKVIEAAAEAMAIGMAYTAAEKLDPANFFSVRRLEVNPMSNPPRATAKTNLKVTATLAQNDLLLKSAK